MVRFTKQSIEHGRSGSYGWFHLDGATRFADKTWTKPKRELWAMCGMRYTNGSALPPYTYICCSFFSHFFFGLNKVRHLGFFRVFWMARIWINYFGCSFNVWQELFIGCLNCVWRADRIRVFRPNSINILLHLLVIFMSQFQYYCCRGGW